MRLHLLPAFVVPVHCVLTALLITGVSVDLEMTFVGGLHTEQAVYPLSKACDKVVSI